MNKNKVEEILDAIFQLQELDVQIAELEISKVYKPRILKDLREGVDLLEEELAKTKEDLSDVKTKAQSMQLDIDAIKNRLSNSKEKLSKVTSNREYEAVQDEILENEELLALKEEEVLRIFDKEEKLENDMKALEEKYQFTKSDSEKKISQIESELSHVEDNIKVIENKREIFSKPIPKRLMFTYNRIRKGLGNMAIVNVKQRACGGCFQQLTSQTIQDLIRGDEVIFCPSCGRILRWDENESPVES